jgi:TolB-like protein
MDSGMTDFKTIVAIAEQLGARYVVAGHITSVGKNKLLVISIIDIRNLQQVTGDYQTYTTMLDIRNKLPNMVENIIQATQRNTGSLPKLAIVPVQLQGGVNQRDADTLTQILSIHLIRSGKYTVYPRTSSLEQVKEEYNMQSAFAAERNKISQGFGENPNLVLSVVARKLENVNMFNAVIIDLFTGEQVIGRSVDYRDIDERA